jgi:hypothetical protein
MPLHILLLLDWTVEFSWHGHCHIFLSLEEVAVYSGHKVLVKFDDNNVLIVGHPQGNLGRQLRPCPIPKLNTLISI